MSEGTDGFAVTDRFDPLAMQAFMRQPELYWPVRDALSPQPEQVDFVAHMLEPTVWTLAGTLRGHIVGYVQFVARTTVMVELTAGFHPQFRGRIAKAIVQYAIGLTFRDRGVLKIIALVPADNRAARYGTALLGFHEEARLRRAIVRPPDSAGGVLQDIIIYSLDRGISHTNGRA
jgi:RimJ/RimL family protein N-acetyltransferase